MLLKPFSWRFWLGAFIQREFLISLEREAQASIPKAEYAVAGHDIRQQLRAIYDENANRILHEPDKFHLHWAALVLAAYRALVPTVVNQDEAVDLISSAFLVPFRKLLSLSLLVRYGISPLQPEKAFPRLAKNFKPKGERFFGPSFVYEQEILNEKHSFVNVRKCFFQDFFQANGVPELTRVLCQADNVNMDELNKPKYGVKFERLTAIGYGDDMCRFRITNTRAQ